MEKKKVNNMQIELIPGIKPQTQKDPLFEEPYPFILLLAKRKSGKSTVVYNLLKHLLFNKDNKDTVVFFFCSKIYNDPSYESIIRELKSRNINYIIETSFMKKGKDQLNELLKHMENNMDSRWSELDPLTYDEHADNVYKDKNFIIVIDDLSAETQKSAALKNLMKSNRHLKCKLIISTQYLNDLPPDGINNLSHAFLFDKIQIDKAKNKLREFYDKIGMTNMSYDKFEKMYRDATKPTKSGERSHSFLFMDIDNEVYRRNLDEEYNHSS